jgi:hypothetical protein
VTPRDAARRAGVSPRGDLRFVPRVVRPIQIEDAILLAGAEGVRAARETLETGMPWVRARLSSNPLEVSRMRIERPTALVVDDTALNLVDVAALRTGGAPLVVVLLSAHPLVQSAPPEVARQACPFTEKADLVFAVDDREGRPGRIIVAAVRAAEDYLNIAGRSRARRFIFLVVDDEPRWFSQFLPVLYEIIGQRAAVKLARTYEEASAFLFGDDGRAEHANRSAARGRGDDVVCLITDIFFPKGGVISSDAGRDLIMRVKRRYARIPVIIASKAEEARALGDSGLLLPKGDPGFLSLLRQYIRDRTGMADFVVYDEAGREWHRVKDVRGMQRMLSVAGRQGPSAERLRAVLTAYGEQDLFSTWFYMHGYRRLADRLRPERLTGRRLIAVLKRGLDREVALMRHTPFVLDGTGVMDLPALLAVVRTAPADRLQTAADHDAISSWLDQQGYCELAEELRPLHARGMETRHLVVAALEKWIAIYRGRTGRRSKPPRLGRPAAPRPTRRRST